MRNGYKMLYLPTHHRADATGCVYEHIVVAEKKLGRLLEDSECVHHINKIRNDNSADNLIVFKTVKDHSAFHKGCEIELEGDVYIAKTPQNKSCPICGHLKDNKAALCLQCSQIQRRKVERPDKELLSDLIQRLSFTAIGKMYNVSDNAVRKWCSYYNLPFKKNEIDLYKRSITMT